MKNWQRWKEQCLHISAEKTGHLSTLYAEWQAFFFPLQSSSLFHHVQFITSCLISSPLPAHEAGGSIYPWCNIYTYTCWTYSPHTSDRLIFTRVKSSHGSSRLRQTKCWHVLPAVFPALYMADQPWMSRLTGPAAARCVSSTLNKAKTSPVSLNRVRDWRSNGSACLLCQSVLSIPTMLR